MAGRRRPAPVATGRPLIGGTRRQLLVIGGALVAHVLLALAMRAVPEIATAHAIACLLAGLVYAMTTKHVRSLSIVAAYIAGCEVLWRMTGATVFWEYGKYATIAILLVGLFRLDVKTTRNRGLALAYFGLLLPSVVLTFTTLDLDLARQQVSFYLSGPLAITVAVLFYSRARLNVSQLRTSFLALIAPVVGIGALSFSSMMSRQNLEFGNGSNVGASGGFGPNQVSAVLGLAVLFLILMTFDRDIALRARVAAFVLAGALSIQTTLTFARGGLIMAFAGIAVALMFQLARSGRGRAAVIIIAAIGFGLAKYVIEPRLDDYTGGALSARYTSSKTSGRSDFVDSELEIFSNNPVLGVGPGIGMYTREEVDRYVGASHTEYTRMLAEHGILGILSLCCLIALAWRAVRDARSAVARSTAAAFVVWTALFLLINDTRIVAPALVFGLAFAVPLAAAAATKPVIGRRVVASR